MTLDKPAGLAAKLGPYELLKELPAGGVGATWVARVGAFADTEGAGPASEDPKLFAVLRLPRHLTKKTEAIETFATEARAAEDLRHTNIVGLVEVGNQDGEAFVVTEHVEGETLTALLAAAGADGLPAPVVLRMAVDILSGLEAAHTAEPNAIRTPGQGPGLIAHGELSPQHIVVGADGVTRVSGLAWARALSRLTPPLGARNHERLAYAAPERVKTLSSPTGAPPTARADVFSVAVILWEALAKQRLFTSKIEAAIIQKVLTTPVPALGTVSGVTVEASIAAAITRALDRDPEKRLASAGELRAEIAASEGAVATAEQVAAEVERLAGKALATRRTDLRNEITRRAKRGSTIPPPAATKASAVVAPRKPTLLGFSGAGGVRAPAVPAGLAGMAGSRKVTPPAFSALPPPPPLDAPEKGEMSSSEAVTVPKPPIPVAATASGTHTKTRPMALSVDLEDIEEPAEPASASPDSPATNARPAAQTLLMGSEVVVSEPSPRPLPAAGKAATPPPVPAHDDGPSESKPVAKAPAKPPSPARVPPKPATATPLPTSKAVPNVPTDGGASTTPTSNGRGKVGGATEKVGPGSTLGRYEILMPVARGGMASVWAAKLPGSRGFQKIFAIKTMLPDVSDDPEFESMFLDEARVAARIRHPNVVEIIDLGEQDEILYLVMEWVDGENLGTLVKAARGIGGVPLPIVLRIASQVCAGLHAAHELRDDEGHLVDLVHRDISPANVLVSSSGFVKIVDFGIAKSKGRLHITRVGGMVKGKTPYLSPEQLGQLPIDRRSDIFSFGVLLYVLTTGLHPFRGETDSKTIENIALREPVPLRALQSTLPEEFETLVLKALAKDPKDRFATAAEMHRALDQIAGTLGESTTEEDVAAFVRKALGDSFAKRSADLRAAIDKADGRNGELSAPSRAIAAGLPRPKSDLETPPPSVANPGITTPDAKGEEPKAQPATVESDDATKEASKDSKEASKGASIAPPPAAGIEALAVLDIEGTAEGGAVAAALSQSGEAPDAAPNDDLDLGDLRANDSANDTTSGDESSSRPVTRTEAADGEVLDAPRPRKPAALIAVAVVLVACAALGGMALFGGSDAKPTASSGTAPATRTVTASTPAEPAPPPPSAPPVAETAAETATTPPTAEPPPAPPTAETAAAKPPHPSSGGGGVRTPPPPPTGGGKGKGKKQQYNPGGI